MVQWGSNTTNIVYTLVKASKERTAVTFRGIHNFNIKESFWIVYRKRLPDWVRVSRCHPSYQLVIMLFTLFNQYIILIFNHLQNLIIFRSGGDGDDDDDDKIKMHGLSLVHWGKWINVWTTLHNLQPADTHISHNTKCTYTHTCICIFKTKVIIDWLKLTI